MAASPNPHHPSLQKLRDFLLGRLDDDASLPIEQHLESCPSCNDQMQKISQSDVLLDLVREAEKDSGDDSARTNNILHPAGRNPDSPGVQKTEDTSRDSAKKPYPRLWMDREPEISGYEILGELGRGGMGVVYKARHKKLDRLAAIKLLNVHDQYNELALQRLRKEAELLAMLKHPNIVQIYDVEFDRVPAYLVLEYVDGADLAHQLAAETMPVREAARLVAQLAQAMHAAHQAGIVHRDLKPANVLIDGETNIPKITDFGLARQTDSKTRLTRAGSVMGTPGYMAPEQAQAKNDRVEARTDVYSLGAILYECLTGKPPFTGSDPAAIVLSVLRDAPVPPSELHPNLPRDLETICLKCLEKDIGRRYATAHHLAEDLDRFLDGKPIAARPVGPAERTWRWAKRHPVQVGLIAAVSVALLAIVGVIVGLIYQEQLTSANTMLAGANTDLTRSLSRETKLGKELRAALTVAEKAKIAEAKTKEKVDQLLYLRQVSLAHSEWENGEPARARRLLERCEPKRRHWEWRYLHHLFHPERRVVRVGSGEITRIAYTPDGKSVVCSTKNGDIKIWNAADGQPHRVDLHHPDRIMDFAIIPNTTRILTACYDHKVRVCDIATDKIVKTLRGRESQMLCVACSPDGKTYAGGRRESVTLWNANGKPITTIKAHQSWVKSVCFSPDNRFLATASYDRTVKLWENPTGKLVRSFRCRMKHLVVQAKFSPDGSVLAVCGYFPEVYVVDSATGKKKATLRGHADHVNDVAFSEDGKRLASCSKDGTIKVWNLREYELDFTLKGHTQGVAGVAFIPNGQEIVSGGDDGTVRFWNGTQAPEAIVLTQESSRVRSPVVCPNGRYLAYGTEDDVVIRDMKTLKNRRALGANFGEIMIVRFSPDGKYLVACGQNSARLWNVADGAELHTFTEPRSPTSSIAFSPNGQQLAIASSGDLFVWDQKNGLRTVSNKAHFPRISGIEYIQKGSQLVTAGYDKEIKIWDAKTGDLLKTFQKQSDIVLAITKSPDGRYLAAGCADGTIRVWDIQTWNLVQVIDTNNSDVVALAFTPDNHRLISAVSDDNVRIWDWQFGQQAIAFHDSHTALQSMVLSPDGTRLIRADGFNRVFIWEAPKQRR